MHSKLFKIIVPFIILIVMCAGGIKLYQQLNFKPIKSNSIYNTNSAEERYVLWKQSIEMLCDNPFLGVGAGNWKIFFPHYGLGTLPPEARNATLFYIRPENDFFWVFAETGILGGLFYLGIMGAAVLFLLKRIFTIEDTKERLYLIIILNALILYAVTACFGFPKDRFYLHTLLALILALAMSFKFSSYKKPHVIKLPLLFFLAAFVFISLKGTRIYAAEKKLALLLEERIKNNHQEVINLSESIATNNYLMDQTSTPIAFYKGVAFFSKQQYDQALLSFHEAEKLHPYHLHVLNNLATCYALMGNTSMAISYFDKALQVSPDFQDAIINLSGLYYNNKNFDMAYKYFIKARTDNTQNALYVNLDALFTKTINDSLVRLTHQYLELGYVDKAEACLKKCLHKNKMSGYHDLQVAIVRKRQLLKKNNKSY